MLLGPPLGWSLDFPKRLPTLREFLKFWGPNLYYDDFAAGDWRPGLAELRNYFVELGGRFRGRVRRAFTGRGKVNVDMLRCGSDSTFGRANARPSRSKAGLLRV